MRQQLEDHPGILVCQQLKRCRLKQLVQHILRDRLPRLVVTVLARSPVQDSDVLVEKAELLRQPSSDATCGRVPVPSCETKDLAQVPDVRKGIFWRRTSAPPLQKAIEILSREQLRALAPVRQRPEKPRQAASATGALV